MKKKGIFKRIGETFVAVDKRATDILAALADGDKVFLWVHKARYPEHHRYAMAVIQKIADSIGCPHHLMLQWIKRETGRYDWVRMPDGSTEKDYHSIAFESMPQDEFQEFWNDTMRLLSDEVFAKLDDATMNEIRDMIAGKVDV